MLYPVEKLLANRDNLCTIRQTAKVREALAQMAQGDFSQLPVVDEQGNLVGLISEQTITRTYYHVDENVSLFDLTVDHCMTPAVTLNIDADIFEALDRLQRTYAIVITENRKPVGLLTFYDTTHFFRNLTEGLIFVEDIEITLRQYIEAIYTTEQRREQATINTFGMDGAKPRRDYESLTLGQYINLITHPKNWPDFEPFLAPTNLFRTLMDGVRETRNHLAHFRGELDHLQFDQLRRARDWLSSRPKPKSAPGSKTSIVVAPIPVESPVFGTTLPSEQGQYVPLTEWLRSMSKVNLAQLTFDQIDELLQTPLPESARQHRSWWNNDYTTNRQSLAWLNAGWQVEDVDFTAGTVTFHQVLAVLQQLYFADLLERLKAAKPGLTRATKAQLQNWWSFSGGRSGFGFAWVFASGGFLRVELYIDTGDRAVNKRAFNLLSEQKEEIEKQIGVPLEWDLLPTKRACRISISQPGTVNDPPEVMEKTKSWALMSMIRLVDTFQPRIKELALD